MEVRAIGPIGACLLAIKVPDPHAFRSRPRLCRLDRADPEGSLHRRQAAARRDHPRRRRELAPHPGPGRHLGDQAGAQGQARIPRPGCVELVKRKPPKLAAVALANKIARIAWKLMVSGERYDPEAAAPARLPDGKCRTGSRRQGRCAPPTAVALEPALTTLADGAPDCRRVDEPSWSSKRAAAMTVTDPNPVQRTGEPVVGWPKLAREGRWRDRSIPRHETLR